MRAFISVRHASLLFAALLLLAQGPSIGLADCTDQADDEGYDCVSNAATPCPPPLPVSLSLSLSVCLSLCVCVCVCVTLASLVILLLGSAQTYSLFKTLRVRDRFSLFAGLLQRANLKSLLKNSGLDQGTVFAPNDAALLALGQSELDRLARSENRDQLEQLLLAHVVHDRLTFKSLKRAVGALPTEANSSYLRLRVFNRDTIYINEALIINKNIKADNGIVHEIDAVLWPSREGAPEAGQAPVPVFQPDVYSVFKTISEREQFSILAAMLEAADLREELKATGLNPVTLFAPNNNAFLRLDTADFESIANPSTIDGFRDILRRHIVPRNLSQAALQQDPGPYETLVDGQTVMASSNEDGGLKLGRANIVTANILASNGYVHELDEVLLPSTIDQLEEDNDSIYATITNNGNFSLLESLVLAADLDGLLGTSGGSPLTLFAPTNNAFEELGSAELNRLRQPENKDELQALLLRHLVPRNLSTADLEGIAPRFLEPLDQASFIHVTLSGNNIRINEAVIVRANISALNGYIHAIDVVITQQQFDLDIARFMAMVDRYRAFTLASLQARLYDQAAENRITVFLPSETAFEALNTRTLLALFEPQNTDILRTVVAYHFHMEDAFFSSELVEMEQASTLEGRQLQFSENANGTVFVNDIPIVKPNLQLVNGVAHGINKLLVPGGMSLEQLLFEGHLHVFLHEYFNEYFHKYFNEHLNIHLHLDEYLNKYLNEHLHEYLNFYLHEHLPQAPQLYLIEYLHEHLNIHFHLNVFLHEYLHEYLHLNFHVNKHLNEHLNIHVHEYLHEYLNFFFNEYIHEHLNVYLNFYLNYRLLNMTELLRDIALYSDVTVFVPTNEALAETLDEVTLFYLIDEDNLTTLHQILLSHVVNESLSVADMSALNYTVAASGEVLALAGAYDNLTVDNASIVEGDIEIVNGFVHRIDKVLLPANYTRPVPDAALLIALDDDYAALTVLMDASRLDEDLSELANFSDVTLLVPENAAISAFFGDDYTWYYLTTEENLTTLRAVLRMHVINESYSVAELGNMSQVTAWSGAPLVLAGGPGNLTVNNATVLEGDIEITNGLLHRINQVLLPPNMSIPIPKADLLLAIDSDYSLFYALLSASGLETVVGTMANVTVIAPSNDAIEQAFDNLDFVSLLQEENRTTLRTIMAHHIINESLSIGELSNRSEVETLAGTSLLLTGSAGNLSIDNASVLEGNVLIVGGYVHRVDQALLPANLSMPTIEAAALLQSDSAFAGLMTLINVSNMGSLLETVSSLGDVTLFVPSNEAIAAAFDEGMMEALLSETNLTTLRQILALHVVPDASWSLADLSNMSTVVTATGAELELSGGPDELQVGNASVIEGNIVIANGFVHRIDRVLLPANLSWPSTHETTLEDVFADDEAAFAGLLALLNSSEASELARNLTNVTLFVPTNDAFAALSSEEAAALQANGDEAGPMWDFAFRHIVSGTYSINDLNTGGAELVALNGDVLSVEENDGVLTIESAQILPNASVAFAHGWLHRIDQVLWGNS
ncbi:uncharacterized protein MONBRDRAFT_28185 [Monosiga brevicollis MX1]|uniref:FAS1 domain-containing protein n=1 Tax=Monosiga brevicollis TaxID=81824 RepID=A9V7F9_MONBE|nr:uncharacterized protein MONBRDRAFT_28185 [Monosiga brevicollis MX1]EDQ86579.1 predicted protein [Monosiga brevicollis MX1]|eukprot:XP_001748692.1 hypothetical protein [Monosiga brevicollis MX1]